MNIRTVGDLKYYDDWRQVAAENGDKATLNLILLMVMAITGLKGRSHNE